METCSLSLRVTRLSFYSERSPVLVDGFVLLILFFKVDLVVVELRIVYQVMF